MRLRLQGFVRRSATIIAVCAAAGGSTALAQAPPIVPGSEISFSIGFFEPHGESDLWRENSQFMTGDPNDFDGAVGGVAFAWHLNPYLDIQLGSQYYQAGSDVSYRNLVDEYGDTIDRRLTLTQVPLEFSFKFFPIPRMAMGGERGSGVLRPVVPYFGGGAGVVLWEYGEEGWFVDDPVYPSYAVYDDISTSGTAFSAHVLAGLEIECSPWIAIWFEGRYRWASDQIDGAYGYGSEELDLSGGSLSVGTSFRF